MITTKGYVPALTLERHCEEIGEIIGNDEMVKLVAEGKAHEDSPMLMTIWHFDQPFYYAAYFVSN